ncbi:MAG: hypothetical protein Ct9H300mP19_18450 [Dehalococcoidia bacterium]|nr:MAG: hypothetical protein Ct9H300mP19_18450 [Dehalococcoidia bacterium]
MARVSLGVARENQEDPKASGDQSATADASSASDSSNKGSDNGSAG